MSATQVLALRSLEVISNCSSISQISQTCLKFLTLFADLLHIFWWSTSLVLIPLMRISAISSLFMSQVFIAECFLVISPLWCCLVPPSLMSCHLSPMTIAPPVLQNDTMQLLWLRLQARGLVKQNGIKSALIFLYYPCSGWALSRNKEREQAQAQECTVWVTTIDQIAFNSLCYSVRRADHRSNMHTSPQHHGVACKNLKGVLCSSQWYQILILSFCQSNTQW